MIAVRAGGDAMVTVLEGKGRFTVGGDIFYLETGDTLIMPKDIPPLKQTIEEVIQEYNNAATLQAK